LNELSKIMGLPGKPEGMDGNEVERGAHTVLFDKTGTLTVGGARLLSIEVAPPPK
jgi:hypothetical protein